MKLQKAFIYGFGQWIDQEFDFTGNHFLCFYGENESGKSTLQQFILFMLFGMPPKQRKFFRPKTSSKMGGRLTIWHKDKGEIVIERMDGERNGAALCRDEKGSTYHETWLNQLLNGMTLEMYRSIHSFSAVDLATICDMKEEDLGDLLLSIGMTGSTQINIAEKQLQQKMEALFKPYGKLPTINKQLTKLDDLYGSRIEQQALEASYNEEVDSMRQLKQDIQMLQEELVTYRKYLSELERQKQVLPQLYEYKQYEEQLQHLPGEVPFPENGLERHQALKNKWITMNSHVVLRKETHDQQAAKLKELKESLSNDEAVYQTAIQFMERGQTYHEREERIAEEAEKLNKLLTRINMGQQELNMSTNDLDFEQLHLPFHIEQEWKAFKTNDEQLRVEHDQLQLEEQQLQQQENHVHQEIMSVDEELLQPADRREMQTKLKQNEAAQYDLNAQIEVQQKKHDWEKKKRAGKTKALRFLSAGIGLAIVFLAYGLLQQQDIVKNIGWIILLLGVGQWLFENRAINRMDQEWTAITTNVKPETILTDEEKNKLESMLETHDLQVYQLQSLKEQQKKIDIQSIQLDEKNSAWQQKMHRHQQLLETERAAFPFLDQMEPVYWPELYPKLRDLQQLYREKIKQTDNLNRLKTEQQKFEHDLDRFFEQLNWEWNHVSTVNQLEQITTFAKKYAEKEMAYQSLEKSFSSNEEGLKEVTHQRQAIENEMQVLWELAGADTEDDFYHKANQLQEWQHMHNGINKIIQQTAHLFTKQQWRELLNQQPTSSEIEQAYDEKSKLLTELEEQLNSKRQQLADIHAELSKLEASEDLSRMNHQYQMEIEKLQQLGREWAVLKTAKEVLAETKRSYQSKHVEQVIARTTAFFCQLTDGKYIKVIPPMEGTPFQVEAKDEIRYTVNELSQGTIDQLYVSLRLAGSEMVSQNNSLPFMIDDAFVHFDSLRTERMLDILETIAHSQQVIYFTCRKDVLQTVEGVKLALLSPKHHDRFSKHA